MDFPILDLMDQQACYQKLLALLHPDGLTCPRCGGDRLAVHRHHKDSPVVDHRCRGCRRVFHLFTGTPWQGTHRTPAEALLILRGFAQGIPTAQLARELGASRPTCWTCGTRSRPAPRPPPTARRCRTTSSRPTRWISTRGKKGVPHTDPEDPPRRRANKAVGHGTWDSDRPPVCGVAGRSGGRLAPRVGRRNWAVEWVHQTVVPWTKAAATVYADEWNGYKPLKAAGRGHATVNHHAGEWARDDDGDGVREVHCNTREGLWTGLRNFLRPFRAASKVYLERYIKMFELSSTLKGVGDDFLRVLLGCRQATGRPPGCRPTNRSGT